MSKKTANEKALQLIERELDRLGKEVDLNEKDRFFVTTAFSLTKMDEEDIDDEFEDIATEEAEEIVEQASNQAPLEKRRNQIPSAE